MGFFRNPEVRLLLGAGCGLTVLTGTAGYLYGGKWFMALCVGLCVMLTLLCLILCAAYLRRMEQLTDYVTRVLRGEEPLDISRNREGAFSIFQNELFKLSAALRQQLDDEGQKRRQMSDALSDISHQLKTPLTSLTLTAQLLRAPEMTDAERVRRAREMDAQLRRMQGLTAALLKQSRLDAGAAQMQPDRLCVGDLIRQAAEPLLIPMELMNIDFSVTGDENDCLEADRMWTAEALGNVLKNALEHTPQGGAVTVFHEETPISVTIAVENSGARIAPEDMPHIFKRFYRGRDAKEGSVGIGLALARRIVTEQNGVLTAKNLPGGVRFEMVFYKRVV